MTTANAPARIVVMDSTTAGNLDDVDPDPAADGDEPLVALEPEVDADDLPTVKGFFQLCEWAREKLEVEEPEPKRRERVARAMAEAYCQGAVHRVSMERGWA